MRSIRQILNSQVGSMLLPFVILIPFLILIVSHYMQLTVTSFNVGRKDQFHTQAQLATDAGIDLAMEEINKDNSWTGVAETQVHNDGSAKTTYQVTVTDLDSTHKQIETTGRAYRLPSSTALASVKVKVKLRAVQSGGFSIVSGVGGLSMLNSAKVVNGSVYVNGKLSMANSSQIGLSITPVDTKVAHQSCPVPANATYPRVCNSGENGEPISITGSSHIYGEVQGTNQTTGTNMSNPGLVAGTVPPAELPDYDRAAQKAAVASTITASNADCGLLGLLPKTWTANLKITGNVTLGLGCIVTVEGNVWITGNLTVQNVAVMKVKEGLATPPVIMIDGSSGLTMRNSAVMLSNLALKGFRIITFYSTAACSPDCADVTGTDLFNSQSHTTISLDNLALAAQTEFYARWSKLSAGNAGSVGALAGQAIELKNSLAVTFGTSVSGFATTTWVIDSYRRVF